MRHKEAVALRMAEAEAKEAAHGLPTRLCSTLILGESPRTWRMKASRRRGKAGIDLRAAGGPGHGLRPKREPWRKWTLRCTLFARWAPKCRQASGWRPSRRELASRTLAVYGMNGRPAARTGGTFARTSHCQAYLDGEASASTGERTTTPAAQALAGRDLNAARSSRTAIDRRSSSIRVGGTDGGR